MTEFIIYLAWAVIPLFVFLASIGSATIGWLFYRAIYLRYYADSSYNDRVIFYLQEELQKQKAVNEKLSEDQQKILEFILRKS